MSNRTVEQLTFGAHLNSWKLPKMWWSRNIAKGAPEPKTGVKMWWSGVQRVWENDFIVQYFYYSIFNTIFLS